MRAHRTLIVSLILALVLAVPAGAAAKRLIIGGSTSVLPLAQKLATAYHKAYPKIPAPQVERRAVGHRHQRRRQRQLRHRRLLARPDRRRRPHGLVFTKIAARRRVHDHQRHRTRLQPLPAGGRRHLHGQHPRLERSRQARRSPARSTCSTATAPPVPQDAFQHIFLGETLKISPSATAEASNGLEQQHVEKDEARRSASCPSPTPPASTRSATRASPATCATPAPASTAACVTSGWSPRARPKAKPPKFISWVTSGNKTTKTIINSSWIAVH